MWFLVKSGVLVESTNDKSIIIFLQITADCVLPVTCMQSNFPTYYIFDSWVPFVHFCAWPLAQFHSCFILEVFPHSCK